MDDVSFISGESGNREVLAMHAVFNVPTTGDIVQIKSISYVVARRALILGRLMHHWEVELRRADTSDAGRTK